MTQSWPNKYAVWPKYLPYPRPIQRSKRRVPNASAVSWPQAQFSPPYLPPGSPSFQSYSFIKQDRSLASMKPEYLANNETPFTRGSPYPSPYGAPMPAPATRPSPKLKSIERQIRHLASKRRKTAKDRQRLSRLLDAHEAASAPASRGSFVSVAHKLGHQARQSTGYGDGFAWELAPLQAAPLSVAQYGLGGLGCCCEAAAAKKNPVLIDKSEGFKLTPLGWLVSAGVVAGLGYYFYTSKTPWLTL